MQKGEICYNKTETGHEADDGKSARPQNGNGTKKLTVYLLQFLPYAWFLLFCFYTLAFSACLVCTGNKLELLCNFQCFIYLPFCSPQRLSCREHSLSFLGPIQYATAMGSGSTVLEDFELYLRAADWLLTTSSESWETLQFDIKHIQA